MHPSRILRMWMACAPVGRAIGCLAIWLQVRTGIQPGANRRGEDITMIPCEG